MQREMSGGKELLELRYFSQVAPKEERTAEELRDAYFTLFQTRLDAELKRGTTLFGPQKDDFAVYIDRKNARVFGSQGQQRSAVLALKLAEAAVLEQVTGEQPVILLDDVMSELDGDRRDYLLNRVEDRQIFLTCCDPSAFSALEKGARFSVAGGIVTAAEQTLESGKAEG